MREGSHHNMLERAGVVGITPASISGELIDLGDYPGMRISARVTTRVYGELIQLERLDSVLGDVDLYEGPDFKREIVNVTLEDGRSHFAWTYVLAHDAGECEVIPSGRWQGKTESA